MSTKSLKKQLMAAIAMVLVAAVALGSSTYAWFVSNNSVKATTANISAQSNAAFLQIAQASDAFDGSTLTTFTPDTATALYPATAVADGSTYKFQTGYASSKAAADINSAGLIDIASAKLAQYTLLETVYISAQEGSFTNLTGVGLTVAASNGTASDDQIEEAMRILLVNQADKTKWQVWAPAAEAYASNYINGKDLYNTAADTGAVPYATMKTEKTAEYGASGTKTHFPETLTYTEYMALVNTHVDSTSVAAKTGSYKVAGTDILAATVGTPDAGTVQVDMYVFYEGSDHHVYTDNLINLGQAKVTVEFTATQVNEGV